MYRTIINSHRAEIVATLLRTFCASALLFTTLSNISAQADARLDPTSIVLDDVPAFTVPESEFELKSNQEPKPQDNSQNIEIKVNLSSSLNDSNSFSLQMPELENNLNQQVPDNRQISKQLSSAAKKSLIKTNIASVTPEEKEDNKQKLNNLIKQINSINFVSKQQETKSKSTSSRPTLEEATEISEPSESQEIADTADEKTREEKQQYSQKLSPEIIERIDEIINSSTQMAEPQLLAELLFSSGYYKRAAYFFEMAVGQDEESSKLTDTDKAWMLNQQAVCLSNSDPEKALEIYKTLVSQYPNSHWAQLAYVRQNLLEWLQDQQPNELIEQCKAEIKQANN
jgi:tetratricopeptide (TPR) repeat protein